MKCVNCGLEQFINWGLMEPDHYSNASDVQECPHHICQYVYSGKAKKQKEESLQAAIEACAPSPEMKAISAWWKTHKADKAKKV